MSNIPNNWNGKFRSNLTGQSFPNGLSIRDLLYDYYFQLSNDDANMYLDETSKTWKYEDDVGYSYLISLISWLNDSFNMDFSLPGEQQFLDSIPKYSDIGISANPNDLTRWTIPIAKYVINILSCFIQSNGAIRKIYTALPGGQVVAERDLISGGLLENPFNVSYDYWSYAPMGGLPKPTSGTVKLGARIFTFDTRQSEVVSDFALPVLHNAYDLFDYLYAQGISVELDDSLFSASDDPLLPLSNFTKSSSPCTLCMLREKRPYTFEYPKTPPGSDKDFGAYNDMADWATLSTSGFTPVNEDSYLRVYYGASGGAALMMPSYSVTTNALGNMDVLPSEFNLPNSYKVKFRAPSFEELNFSNIFVFGSGWMDKITPKKYSINVGTPDWMGSRTWPSYNVVTENTDSDGISHLSIGIPKPHFRCTKVVNTKKVSIMGSTAEIMYLDIGLPEKSVAKAVGGYQVKPEYQPSTVYLLINVFDAWKDAFTTVYSEEEEGISKEDLKRVILNGIQNSAVPIVDQFDSNVSQHDINTLNELFGYVKTPHDVCVELKTIVSGRVLTIGTLLSEITSWSNSELVGFDFEAANSRINTSGGNFVDSILSQRDTLVQIYYNGLPVGNTLYEIYSRIKGFIRYSPEDISVNHVSACLQWLSTEYIEANKVSLKQEVYSSIALNSEDQSTLSNNLNSIMKDIKSQYDREYNSLMNTVDNQASKNILSSMYLDLINYFSELEVTLNNNSFGADMSSGDIYANVLKHDLEVIEDYGKNTGIEELEDILSSIPDANLFIVPTESIATRMWNDITNYVISPVKTWVARNVSTVIFIPYKLFVTGLWYIGNYLCSDGKSFSVNKKYSHGVLGVPITQSRITIPSYIANNVSFSFLSYGCLMTLPFSILHITVDPYDTNTLLVSQYMRLDHANIELSNSTPDIDFLAVINEHMPGLIADINLLHFFIDRNFSGDIFPSGMTAQALYADKCSQYIHYVNSNPYAVLSPQSLNSIQDIIESAKSQYLDSRYAALIAAGAGGTLLSLMVIGAWPIGTIVGIAGLGATAYGVCKECEELDKLYNMKTQEWPDHIKTQMDLTIKNSDVAHALYKFSNTFSDLTSYGQSLHTGTDSCIASIMTKVLASKEISVFNPESEETLYCSSPLTQAILPRYYLSSDSDIQAKARTMYLLIGAALSLMIFRKPIGRFLTITASALAGLLTGSIHKSVGVAWATKAINDSLQENLPGVIENQTSEVQTSIDTVRSLLDQFKTVLEDIKDINDKPIIYN